MNSNGRKIITRVHLERRYEELGLMDYKLRNLKQLREIHDIDVNEIAGYNQLSDKHKKLFNEAIINFFNAWGLDNRKTLVPKSINFVYEVNYRKQLNSDEFFNDIGQEVFVLDEKGGILRRLHRYVYEKGISFKNCEKDRSKPYLRFELYGEWYHIMSAIEWY